ncbi:hypothetical protein [Paenibacillus jiagnxiensis]|uniref:hypothetical protein n=1 Tax=Paenibacillus jiagnxiensis TaxID=3228926 RepID=UPI0033B4A259
MAQLRDYENPDTYFEFSFLSHTPRDDEGSRLILKYFKNSNLVREVKFGWTNLIVRNFIEMTKTFPDNKYDGYFSHFEENLEIKWMHEYSTDLYLLILMDLGTLFTLKIKKEDMLMFGEQFENELKEAPLN